ncbi:tetratricopeptide repeat protein [Roseiconus lacunae]|uniref:Tetratricopeptide repeat protein n=1 Tax=Roseiconus lacunae TaxID=2605694 RepID=A0ABT7PL73_9BACT|nr:tetratricopeptide repeat protein [Roseiconus lacunae]MDM4017252.1 tetratricopeptide repeat protein [Roseiconus lacunae]
MNIKRCSSPDSRSTALTLSCVCSVVVCAVLPIGCSPSNPEPTQASKTPVERSQAIGQRDNERVNERTGMSGSTSAPEHRSDPPSAIIETSPIDPRQETQLASQALNDEEFESAYRHARNAYRASPDDPAVMFVMARVLGQRQRFPEAIRMLDRVAKQDPNATLPALGQSAQWLIQDGQWEKAESRLKKILEFVPAAAMVERELAKLYLRQGRRDEAARYIKTLTQQGEISAIYLRTLIQVAIELGDESSGQAEESIGRLGVAKSLAGKPSSEKPTSGKQTRKQAGYRAALEVLDGPVLHRLELPVHEAAFRGRLLAYIDDRSALNEWGEDWNETFVDSPVASQLPDAWFALGHWHAHHGRIDLAIESFCYVVLRDPTDAEAYANLAELTEGAEPGRSADLSGRSEAIKRTRMLAKSVTAGGSQQVDLPSIEALAKQLRELRRVDEALAWEGLKIAFDSSLTASQREAAMGSINRERVDYVNSLAGKTPAVDMSFVLCGLDPPRENRVAKEAN